jgi:hypothetical protein
MSGTFSSASAQAWCHIGHLCLPINDLIMFVAPSIMDVSMAKTIFDIFEGASGLGCNLAKCQLVSIHYAKEQVQDTLTIFPCQHAEFPITFLGMPPSVYKLSRIALQPIADKMESRLTARKGKHLHRSG